MIYDVNQTAMSVKVQKCPTQELRNSGFECKHLYLIPKFAIPEFIGSYP
jgi:hypothetical protein